MAGEDEGIGTNPRGAHLPIWRHCQDCGLWQNGPLRNRTDVPEPELLAAIERAGAQRGPEHVYQPAPRRAGGLVYTGGERELIISHGWCPSCSAALRAETQARYERMQARLRGPAQEPPEEPEAADAHERLKGGEE